MTNAFDLKNFAFTTLVAKRRCMRRFVLTGAPDSGKTTIIRQLELDGFSVVQEAATDVIALEQARGVSEPWKHLFHRFGH